VERHNVTHPESRIKEVIRLEPVRVGSEQFDVEAMSENIGFLAAVRRYVLTPCPNNWQLTQEVSGFGDNAAGAEAEAAAIAEKVGEILAPVYEKELSCESCSCKIEAAKCVFDWGLIGKPTPAVALPAATTKKHKVEVTGKWESKQKIGFGCFCVAEF
jgi:hypothetical protein